MNREEHFHDPDAPKPNRLVPAASAVVIDDRGRVLLGKRADNGLWTIPGGAMDPGETIAATAIRETKEETGIDVEVTRLVGIYSDPNHVIAYADGEVRQQFSVCFACRPTGGDLHAQRSEVTDVGWFTPDEIQNMDVHPSIRLRIAHCLEERAEPYLG